MTAPTRARVAPLYRQIARRIEADFQAAMLPGRRLPSERVLCERYRVSRVTMRSALGVLAEQGRLTPAPARGWFVPTDLRARPAPQPPAALQGFSEFAASQGQSTSARVLECAVRPATLDEAELFAIVPGASIFELRRLRFLQDLVIAVDRSRVPLQTCPDISRHDFAIESLYAVLRAAPVPVVPSRADYAVEAVAAGPEETALLELPQGIPLLVASQRTFDGAGRTIELGQTCYRGDRFRFRASIGST